ncbi:hypothetical protein PRIPAC_98068 [Pristionchus pacificus]|uniref:Uncharacterized protein n=1 Tax=Pristionchus pacificus TaxID=54126 RepID=A0A2A6BD83_PRIPA|nr:hypothetical protein PRIPAC_98068 [Pristionchus pacificus]|eukprot:PDM63853.1 hypothetical protein PRIPAC_49826 [Pristionchus pacificus]
MVPAPEVVNRILPDLSESEEEVEENDAALRRIYGARKMGAMTEEQQRFYEKMQERKRMIRRRTQAWIVCEGTHVQLDEEEQRLFEEASTLIFSSLRDPNRAAFLTAQFERLLTMIPPQNRYGYYSLPLHFNDSRHQGLTEFAKLLIEDDYETPVETLIREEARLAGIDSSDHLPQEDGFSACVLRARLTGGSYTPTVPSSDQTGPFVRFQELLASGSRSDPFEKRREELVWTMKKYLKVFVSEECGFDFSRYERIYEVPRGDDHDY